MINSEEYNKFYLQWHITDRCNLRCTHCYQENYSGKSELSLKNLISIADSLFKTLSIWNKKGEISITGGEPLCRNDLFDFSEYLNRSETISNIDFLTNGTLINTFFINNIKKLNKVKYIQVSLDGATASIHNSIRGQGSFEKTIIAIRKLVDCGIEVRIMYTLQKANIIDVPAMFDLAIKEKISGLTFERMVPFGDTTISKLKVLSSKEVREIYSYISKRSDIEFEKGNKLRILKYRPLWVLIDPIRSNNGTCPHKELGSLCSIGLDGICILPNADVLACRRLPIPIGNLLIKSLEEIWCTSSLLWEIADKRNLKGKCNNCDFISKCSGCRAMAYALTGDYLNEDPDCWK